ncbi:MAG TPA: hypothetical protein VG079_07610 [Gaiellaceae bacterium]|nr:hypothetical protein [Gaiellaceae bacterium]
MRTKTRNEPEPSRVLAWRREQLVETGFPPSLAAQVAVDPRYDLHALIELVERDCPPELAVQILAPFEDEAAA